MRINEPPPHLRAPHISNQSANEIIYRAGSGGAWFIFDSFLHLALFYMPELWAKTQKIKNEFYGYLRQICSLLSSAFFPRAFFSSFCDGWLTVVTWKYIANWLVIVRLFVCDKKLISTYKLATSELAKGLWTWREWQLCRGTFVRFSK